MQQENTLNHIFQDEEPVNYRETIDKYTYQWKWFVLAIIIAFLGAFLYLRYTSNLYQASISVLIDDGSSGGSSVNNMAVFENLGLKTVAETQIANEIIILKSKSLMESVVKDLSLNVSYYEEGYVRAMELSKENSPIKATFISKNKSFYTLDTIFKIKIKSGNKFDLINAESNLVATHVFGENIKSAMGNFTITPTNLKNDIINREVAVRISPLKSVVGYFMSQLEVNYVTEDSEILLLTLKDKIKIKAEAALNKLVFNYNENTVENKSLIAQNTNNFISKRLQVIQKDLSSVDKGIQQFKSTNKLTNIPEEADLILNTNSATEQKIIDLNTQLKLTTFFSDYLTTNSEDLIPANLGLADGSISVNTLKYNELLLERNRILKISSNLNPVIVNLNSQIKELRRSINQSLVNLKSSLTISLNTMKQQEAVLNSKIIAVPKQEREFRDIQRQQQIIETLYLYLLQKREENAIALVAKMPNAKIIDIADESASIVSPDRKKVYLIALLLGLIVPFIAFYIRFLLDNKVHSIAELERAIKAPILGDIPKSKLEFDKVVISCTERNNVAEAFRTIRTNINFMVANVKNVSKTIYVTSTIPNEGKTFISINLAAVFALSNKKVLIIDADLRKPKITEYLNLSKKIGLTHFLIDVKLNVLNIIETVPVHNFDLVQSGIIPPNPAELLMNGRFEELIAFAKTKYDYIIIDTPPISLVSDILLLSQKADLFLYVVRADYIDKRLLEIPKKLYKEKKLPNMAVVLNDSDLKKGYGYGYAYAYGEDGIKKFRRKN